MIFFMYIVIIRHRTLAQITLGLSPIPDFLLCEKAWKVLYKLKSRLFVSSYLICDKPLNNTGLRWSCFICFFLFNYFFMFYFLFDSVFAVLLTKTFENHRWISLLYYKWLYVNNKKPYDSSEIKHGVTSFHMNATFLSKR